MLGNLFVITAPSGAGKTTLVKALLAKDSQLRLSVSYTTRPPRQHEKDGVDYHFVDKETFQTMEQNGEFLEHACVHSAYYGTAKKDVSDLLQSGFDVLFEIDWQGAHQLRKHYADLVSIFVAPPSIEILRQRLLDRQQDNLEVIEQRVASARAEMRHIAEFDYVTINKVFEVACADILAIFRSKRLELLSQIERHREHINTLI